MTLAHRSSTALPPLRVALLRGVNLGASRLLSMSGLVETAGGLGWTDVASYLRSGNLVFRSDDDDAVAARRLQECLRSEHGLMVDIVIRSGAQVQALVTAQPYGTEHPSRTVIGCCDRPIEPQAVAALTSLAAPGERVEVRGSDLFAYFESGQAGSKLAVAMTRLVQPAVLTARNLNTMTRLAELLRDQ